MNALKYLGCIAIATGSAYTPFSAFASTKEAPAPASPDTLQDQTVVTTTTPAEESGEIVVTARKNAENILKTPIAVRALTGADLAARGVVSLLDVAAYTPGLNIVNNAAGRNDRSFQQVIVRGFTPSTALSQTTSMFIDGVPVASATALSSVTDPERVEILKGPQSAYFGRQTFAGAFNVVTKLPTDHLTGTINAKLGTRNNYDGEVSLSGPLLGDVLGFRATGRAYGKNGSYQNTGVPSETLGNQSTRTGSLALIFRPASNFTAKAFGMLSTNNDGQSAQGLISAYTLKNAAGAVIVQGQSNCTLVGVNVSTGAAINNPYICGVTPALAQGPSANTTEDSFIKNFLANPRGRVINPADGADGYGLRSRFYHLHLTMDWQVPGTGITLSSLTGMNRERYSQLTDLDNYYDTTIANSSTAAGARSYFDFPFLVERTNRDFSQEVRASFDNKGPFRLTVGASYLNNRISSALGGGNSALGVTTFVNANGDTRSETKGVFFGAGYDITRRLTVNLDGRYQIDKLFAYAAPAGVTLTSNVFAPAGFYPGGSLLKDGTFKNFMPRAIVKFDVNRETMVYASFSKGINPGGFNTNFLTGSPALARTAEALGYRIETKPEKLDNYEIGVKGRLLGNHVRYAFSAYYGIWTDQLNQQNILGVDPVTNQPLNVQASTNTGKVHMKGLEGDLTTNVTRELAIDLSGAITDSKIISFAQATLTQLTGITNFYGKENPLTSKFSGTASAQYTRPIASLDGVAGYVRADYSYKSGMFSNQANTVRTPDLHIVNLRLGVRSDKFTIEGYVTNVFNTHAYTSVADSSFNIGTFAYNTYSSALIVGLPELRTFGTRVKYSF